MRSYWHVLIVSKRLKREISVPRCSRNLRTGDGLSSTISTLVYFLEFLVLELLFCFSYPGNDLEKLLPISFFFFFLLSFCFSGIIFLFPLFRVWFFLELFFPFLNFNYWWRLGDALLHVWDFRTGRSLDWLEWVHLIHMKGTGVPAGSYRRMNLIFHKACPGRRISSSYRL